MVLIQGAAISWQLKVFVSFENETMEDLLYRVRRLAFDQMGSAFLDELILLVANKPPSGTAAGAAEAEVKGVLPLRKAWTSPLSSARRSERRSTTGVPMSYSLSEAIHGRMVVWLLVG